MENNFDLRKFLYNNTLTEGLDLKASEIEEVEEASTKMKKSELKEKIKAEITNVLSEQDDEVTEAEGDEEGGEDDLDAALDAAEDEVGGDEAPAEDPVDGGGEGPEPELSDEAGLSDEETKIQSSLKMAYDNAVSLGDEKLSNQIANTITFFTRAHVVGDKAQ